MFDLVNTWFRLLLLLNDVLEKSFFIRVNVILPWLEAFHNFWNAHALKWDDVWKFLRSVAEFFQMDDDECPQKHQVYSKTQLSSLEVRVFPRRHGPARKVGRVAAQTGTFTLHPIFVVSG